MKKQMKDEAELLAWARESVHGLAESRAFIGIIDSRDLRSPEAVRFTLQIGHALLLDKPIILSVPLGQSLSAKLAKVADFVIYYDLDQPETLQAQLTQALTELGANKQ